MRKMRGLIWPLVLLLVLLGSAVATSAVMAAHFPGFFHHHVISAGPHESVPLASWDWDRG